MMINTDKQEIKRLKAENKKMLKQNEKLVKEMIEHIKSTKQLMDAYKENDKSRNELDGMFVTCLKKMKEII